MYIRPHRVNILHRAGRFAASRFDHHGECQHGISTFGHRSSILIYKKRPQGGLASLQYVMYPLGERAVTVRWSAEMNREANQRALALLKHLENEPFTGYVEAVPAYTSLTVYYDPILVYRKTKRSPYTAVCQWLKSQIEALPTVSVPLRARWKYRYVTIRSSRRIFRLSLPITG